MYITPEEARAAWVRGPTDVDAIARETETLLAEFRRLSQRGPRGPTATRTPARRQISSLRAETWASIKGPELGRKYAHDPFVAARALGFTIECVPLTALQNARRPETTILGRLLPGKIIQIADTLRGYEAYRTVAHELGHGVLGADADEIDCNNFGRYFMHVADEETAAGRWAAWQRAQLDKVRRANAAAARARM